MLRAGGTHETFREVTEVAGESFSKTEGTNVGETVQFQTQV